MTTLDNGLLKDSSAMGHQAIAMLTAETAMDPVTFRNRPLARLDLAFWALTHANDHFGQIVVYLRPSGIPTPATVSR